LRVFEVVACGFLLAFSTTILSELFTLFTLLFTLFIEDFLYLENQNYLLRKTSVEFCFVQPCYHLNYHSFYYLKYFATSFVKKMEIFNNS
jgi:hypothetical protein